MTELILYMSPGACSRVTMTALEEIGLDYEDRALNLGAGEQSGADFLAVNRKGRVPALLVDGELLTENAAILTHLHRLYPDARLLPASGDTVEAARAVSDLIWCASTLHIQVRQVRAPFKLTSGDPADVRADGLIKLGGECAYIADRIGDAGWWYGDSWSIVDTYVYWAYSTAQLGGFPLGDYPRLVGHAERVRARPSFQRTLARERAAVERARLPIDPASL